MNRKPRHLALRGGLLLALLLAALQLTGCATTRLNTPPKGFTALFNGHDLAGWWGGVRDQNPRTYLTLAPAALKAKKDASLPDIQKNWKVDKGELVNNGNGFYLTTDKWYRDIELLIDYKTVPLADSGVYLRGCPQVQIWDYTEKAKFNLGADKGSGGLYNNPPGKGKDPLVKADKPFGEWNSLRIVMVGTRVWVWLNGQQTVKGEVLAHYYNARQPIPEEGPIQLQTHGGEIRWRNIFLREIGADEAKTWQSGGGK